MEKPFIELFSTPNCFYVFEVNKNKFLPISYDAYQFLCNVMSDKNNTDEVPPEIAILQREGYLSARSVVERIQHPYSRFINTFLDRKLSRITLQLTQECNLRCKYCVYSGDKNIKQRSHSNKRMSWETAKRAVDFLYNRTIDSSKVNIGFYGGEPIIEFQNIKRIVDYSETLFSGKDLSFSITTNGTLLNDDIIRFFDEHNISLMISLDGPKQINDANRVFANGKGTYDVVMSNIRHLQSISPEYAEKLIVSMVIDPENDFDCINTICIDGNELTDINISPSIVDKEYDGKATTFSEEYDKKYEYQKFLSILSYLGRYPRNRTSPIANNMVKAAIDNYNRMKTSVGLYATDVPSGPCIPGQMRLFVDVTGKLFPCERVSEKSSAMCIGTIDSGFDFEKVYNMLNIGALTEDKCKTCWAFRYCSICAKKADSGGLGLSALKKLASCVESQNEAYAKLRQYLLFSEIPQFYRGQVRI